MRPVRKRDLRRLTYSFEQDGEQLPFHLGVIHGDSYSDQLKECLQRAVYPGWPQLVMDYRVGNIDLVEMYRKLLRETWELFMLVAHAESIAEASGRPDIMRQFADEPAVELYVGPAWSPVVAALALEAQEPIPRLTNFASRENRIFEAASGLVDMWARLGVTARRLKSGELYLDVENPAA
jgi:hypothetical protein